MTPRRSFPQDDIFFKSEGDAWYLRNRFHFDERISADWPLRFLTRIRPKPRRVLEVGCSNGWRLAEIHQRYHSLCVGIDPSMEAIVDGRRRYPDLTLRRGLSHRVPLPAKPQFDLVIINYVLHWVSRERLLKSLAEIDRCVNDGGYLIIGDFLPDQPTRTRYHHLPAKQVFTYKMDYAGLFAATSLYRVMESSIYDHDAGRPVRGRHSVPSHRRAVCTLLRKSLQTYYADGSYVRPTNRPR